MEINIKDMLKNVSKEKHITEEMELSQSKLVMGFRTQISAGDEEAVAERLMCAVLGGTASSKLFNNVREKQSLCYYCSARLIRGKGIIVIQSGIEKENRQKVLDEINRQLDIMKNGEFSDEDFEASKKAICDAYRSFNDTPDALDIYYGTQLTGDIVTPDEAIENFLAVTRDDVKKTACALSLDTVYMLAGTDKEDGADE